MSNRIIKDFKGWSLINEGGINPPGQGSPEDMAAKDAADLAAYPAIKAEADAKAAAAAKAVADAAAAKAAGQSPVTQAPAAATTQVKTVAPAAPIVPTPDLTKANPAALTPNDWAAIQAKLNAAETVLKLPTLTTKDTNTQYSNQYPNNANVNLTAADTSTTQIAAPTLMPGMQAESRTRLYEALTVDGQVGPLTKDAVAAFVQKYNQFNPNSPQLPPTPATATSIDPAILTALSTIQGNPSGIDSTTQTTTQNPNVVDPASVEAADTLSIEIAEMIVALFASGNQIWAPAKGLINDDENMAKQIFNNYWITNIMPKINMLPADSKNKSRLAATQAAITDTMGGVNVMSDEVTFQIETKNGPMKYTVDTDF
jgi:hypothetical protein